MPTIDIHTHFFPERWPDLAQRFGTPDWPWIKHLGGGRAMIMLGDREFRPVTASSWDADTRIADLDRDGIDIQLVSATPVLFSYQRPAAHALDVAQIFNDALLDLCARGRGRMRALCQVPLQDTDAACRELDRAMKAGHVGVHIGNHVAERNLDDDALITFLHHCADTGAPVLVHPWDMMGRERTAKYMMAWTVGMPAETQLGIVAMILGGAFDRLPKSLKICFAHGGGSFAFLLGRLENAWHNRDVVRGKSKGPPSTYLDRFSVDSAIFDDRALALLVDVMGEDRVMLGSDYPFPLGEQRVGTLVRGSTRIGEGAKGKILGENAAGFFGVA
ncbi:MAG: amidohydrolase [Alphaproteobacteria bacterium]|nr:amidohydrolase [Alphaproteobacteria bacterium]